MKVRGSFWNPILQVMQYSISYLSYPPSIEDDLYLLRLKLLLITTLSHRLIPFYPFLSLQKKRKKRKTKKKQKPNVSMFAM